VENQLHHFSLDFIVWKEVIWLDIAEWDYIISQKAL